MVLKFMFLFLLSISLVSAVDVGTSPDSGQTGVEIELPPVSSFNNNTANVNHSNSTDFINTNLGSIGDFNDTQFERVDQTLTILESWLTTFINTLGFLTSITNIFDQSLNTTDEVTFNSANITTNLTVLDSSCYTADCSARIYHNGSALIITS